MNSESSQTTNMINLLTMCKRAGKMTAGYDLVKEKSYNGEIHVILTAKDLSPKSLKEVKYVGEQSGTVVVETAATIDELWQAIGRKTGIIGILDEGFAKQFRKILK